MLGEEEMNIDGKDMIVWEYEDEEAFVRCQKLWSKWGDIAQDFVAKLVVFRDNKFYSR